LLRLKPEAQASGFGHSPKRSDNTVVLLGTALRAFVHPTLAFRSSLPDLIRQSMQRTCSLSLSVPPHTPDVTMDHRVKPGGDDHR
jgi:hypothetical protein